MFSAGYVLWLRALLIAVPAVMYRKRKDGSTGWKGWLTPVCFFSIGAVGLIVDWLNSLGLYAWLIQVLLVIAGVYCTKYLPITQKKRTTK